MTYCVIEYMPEYLRASHRAAGNSGTYPHNGADRYRCDKRLARELSAGELERWVRIVPDADPNEYEPFPY